MMKRSQFLSLLLVGALMPCAEHACGLGVSVGGSGASGGRAGAVSYAGTDPLVDLVWEPVSNWGLVGEVFELRLVARSEFAQSIAAIEVVLEWDADHLRLLGVDNDGAYNWASSGFPDYSLNQTFLDGNAFYVAHPTIGSWPVVPSQGLQVTTFLFEALLATDAARVEIVPSVLDSRPTRVWGAEFLWQDLTGHLGVTWLRVCADVTSDADGDGVVDCFDECPGTPIGESANTDGCSCSQIICDDGQFCNGAEGCADGICQTGQPPSCDDGIECTWDQCDSSAGAGSGVCVHGPEPAATSCGDRATTECDSLDTCDGAGVCLSNHVPAGALCGDPADDDCTAPDTCDGAGGCLSNHVLDGETCADDGNDCTDDVCDSGVCAHVDEAEGTPCGSEVETECDAPDSCDGSGECRSNYAVLGASCGDPTDDDCTSADTCDGAGGCSDNHEPDDTACEDDDNDCTGDVCEAGVCEHPHLAADAPCGDPTGSECDGPDTCDGAGACLPNNEPDGTPCVDDGSECTDDLCNAGACAHPNLDVGTPCGEQEDTDCDNPDTCDGSGICEPRHEPPDTQCLDEHYCNGEESCDGAGMCQPGASIPYCCETDDDCSDDDVCTGVETCDLLTHTCVAGTDLTCDDGNECTEDSCDPVDGCLAPPSPDGTPCGDPSDIDCDGPDTCDGAGGCIPNYHAEGTACGDTANSDCTDPDTCDGAGACLENHEPDGVACPDDGNDCTDDICEIGICTHPHRAVGTPCGDPTASECDAPDTCDGAGACQLNNEPDGTTCADDGSECTGDLCNAGACMHPNLEFGTPCGDLTDTECDNPDSCDGSGHCEARYEPVGTLCSDGEYCNGEESCNGAGACLPGDSPPNCCETDVDCSDDDVCTGVETCDLPTHTCVDGTPLTCDDGDDCTDDTCDKIAGCLFPPSPAGTTCGDTSDFECDGPDTCDGLGACLDNHEPDGALCADDGNDCTDDICDAGACAHPSLPVGVACGDPTETDCDSSDTCDGAGTCIANHEPDGTPCADDGNDCSDDICAAGACSHPSLPVGTACGDPADTDCNHPDTCDGAGTCMANHEPDGTACADDGNDCSDDICAVGACAHPSLPVGTACGDPTDDDCTAPNACDGAGACLDNHQPVGTPCLDELFCNGEEACDGAGACTPGDEPCSGSALPFCNEDAEECVECLTVGDVSGDGRADLSDFALFSSCETGPIGPVAPAAYLAACRCLDADGDGDIDLADFGAVQWSGGA